MDFELNKKMEEVLPPNFVFEQPPLPQHYVEAFRIHARVERDWHHTPMGRSSWFAIFFQLLRACREAVADRENEVYLFYNTSEDGDDFVLLSMYAYARVVVN